MSLDIIGTLYQVDSSNTDNPVATQLLGWHVNASWPVPELEPYRVEPATPRRVFSGVDTYFYSFPDEHTWQQFYAANEDALMNPPAPALPRRVTRLAFMQRFTQPERLAIRLAAKTVPEIEDYLAMVDAATFIDLERADTIESVNALATASLITQERAAEITTAPVEAAEVYK